MLPSSDISRQDLPFDGLFELHAMEAKSLEAFLGQYGLAEEALEHESRHTDRALVFAHDRAEFDAPGVRVPSNVFLGKFEWQHVSSR